jgi:hypothetical protein
MKWRNALIIISILLAVGPMLACEDNFCTSRNDGSRQSVAACN